jgi:hypothetical protein
MTVPNSDAADETPVGGGSVVTGVLPAMPDAGHDADASLPCGTGVCGTIAMPAADSSDVGIVGLFPNPDSGTTDQ